MIDRRRYRVSDSRVLSRFLGFAWAFLVLLQRKDIVTVKVR